MTKKQKQDQAAHARRALAAKRREQARRPYQLNLSRADARWLYAVLADQRDGPGRPIAEALLAQAFGNDD